MRVTVSSGSGGGTPKMYWTDYGTEKIQRANLDGSNVEDLVTTGLTTPLGIALDVGRGKMYWADGGTSKIQRANLDGSNVEDLITTGLTTPLGIALDVGRGKMYWTDGGTSKIQRANLDGSNVEDLVTTGLRHPFGIALDVGRGKMYWPDNGTAKIQRANLDGSNVEDLITTGLDRPVGIALDVGRGKMYWTDSGTDKIQRANLDGSNVEDLITTGLSVPVGIALDIARGKMYWMDQDTDKIQRANLNGSNVEDLVTTGLDRPYSIALDTSGSISSGGGGGSRRPDLIVQSPSVDNTTPTTGQSLTLSATVRNQGTATAAATTLRYYRSSDATISTSDTAVGTDDVGGLSASNTSVESVSLTAPSSAGMYYYGACVDAVINETDTNNNCSAGVRVTVSSGGVGGICGRTPQVRAAILEQIAGVTDCAQVTKTHLTGLRNTLNIRGKGLTALQTADFNDLSNLRVLRLGSNRLTALPDDIFLGLSNLQDLQLGGNRLNSLNADVFSNLSNLRKLDLGGNRLNRLPNGVFSNLSNLQVCFLHLNQLSSLPDSVFSGLSRLEGLNLEANPGAPFPLTLSLERTDNANLLASSPATVQLKVDKGAPFAMSISLSVTGGSLSQSTGTIAAGSTESRGITVRQSGGNLVRVGVRSVSEVPEDYKGLQISQPNRIVSLSLFATSSDLVVESPSVSDSTLTPGQSFILRATVRNSGNSGTGSVAATTLRYYRSSDATISKDDTEVGTDAISGLSASNTSAESVSLTAPSSSGTYYYGACVDVVLEETEIGNNCSTGVQVTVGAPDLVVESPSVDNTTPTPSQSLTLRATVRNQGTATAAATTLRYYRSSDATISKDDTAVGTDDVGELSASNTSVESVSLTAPSSSGTYYYGACVDAIINESDTNNNCSTGVQVTVGAAGPDLVVESPSVDNTAPTTGQSLTLRTTVRNQGTATATATTLRYYRSSDATISTSDTAVGTDDVGGLSASNTSVESVSLTAPSSYGTYYYGACVESVSGETDTSNNCSSAVTVTVLLYPTKMYWIIDEFKGLIQRANLDGSNVEDLITTELGGPYRIALDVGRGKMYWTDRTTKKIHRANLDGSNVEDLITLGVSSEPNGIALDVGRGKMYWTVRGRTDKIQRANLDGSNVEDLITLGVSEPSGIALDVGRGKMYWTDSYYGTEKIQRANLDGSNVEDLITTGLSEPRGIALDVGRGKMYWTDGGTDKIQRANLDGSNVEDLITTGLDWPQGIALDVGRGKMYWTDLFTDKIQRANLDGSNVEDLITGLTTGRGALFNPRAIALDTSGSISSGGGGGSSRPDLIVQSPSVDNTTPTTGQSLTLRATVRNQGTATAAATTLRYYRSSDATISTSDTAVGTDDVGGLSASNTSVESVSLTAPSSAGTYYYGACVESVSGETNTNNNCSDGVRVTVSRSNIGGSNNPDLVVQSPSVDNTTPTTGQSFTLSATVRNQGTGAATATTLRYYRSSDATISTSDTAVGTDDVGGLSASNTSDESVSLTAPSSAGTYYYGACVESVSGETDTNNNCSTGVQVTVGAPDLVVESPSVDNTTPTTGQSLTLSATVRNQGTAAATATTLRYYRSSDATISKDDTEVGTDAISGLSASNTSAESVSLTAPSSSGTYYYGACVESVSGETNTNNNCSSAVTVTVSLPKMYWMEARTDKIKRANLDGSNVEDLITTGLTSPWRIALDVGRGKMYWTALFTDKIKRANLDGSNVEDLITTGSNSPHGIALDVGRGKMYWTQLRPSKIKRANLDGSNVEDLITTGLVQPVGIALDVGRGKMYWTDCCGSTSKIKRANLDGSNVEDLITTGLENPSGIALDVGRGKMYWTDYDGFTATGRIQRANLDGSNVEDLITTGLNWPRSIALDVGRGKMYWTDAWTDKVQRANLNGSNVEDLITITGETSPRGIALDTRE